MPKTTPAPANGITAEVIRDCMKPYGFSPDLLEDFVASLPPPPPEASTAWRLRHLTRLVQEVAIFMPADDAQARLATNVVGLRELSVVLRRRAADPGCRRGNCAGCAGPRRIWSGRRSRRNGSWTGASTCRRRSSARCCRTR